jgi:hypothetical protein
MSQNHGARDTSHVEDDGQLQFLISSVTILECQILGCTDWLVPIGRGYTALAAHLAHEHGYQLGTEYTCWWNGCQCFELPGCSENHRPRNIHPWRGRDMLNHILNAHLDFVYVCSKCGTGPFSQKSSCDRHEASCRRGRVPARCRSCLQVFPSIITLGAHAESGLCRLAP